MKRVLHIVESLSRNGTETFIMNVFREIDRTKVMFDFLLYRISENGYENEAKALGADIFLFTQRKEGIRKHIKSLEDFFSKNAHKYDAVHYSGTSFTNMTPIMIAKKYGIPVRIVHSHGSNTFRLHNILLHKFNRRRIGTIATDFLACSQIARDWGFKGSKVYEKSKVIPNGIELDKYCFNQEKRDKTRKELGLENAFIVGNTAGFRQVKNHPFIIETFIELLKIRPDAVLLLAGDGPTKQEIENKVKEAGISGSVKFLGSRTDVDSLLQGMDSYIFPSFYEGLPFSLIEAQAAGLPVLCSSEVSPEIKLSENLVFYPLSESPSNWAKKLNDISKRERLISLSNDLRKYDIKETCQILTDIYYKKNPE